MVVYFSLSVFILNSIRAGTLSVRELLRKKKKKKNREKIILTTKYEQKRVTVFLVPTVLLTRQCKYFHRHILVVCKKVVSTYSSV